MKLDSATKRLHHFMAHYVASVEQLEILCLLSGSPERQWSVKDVLQVVQSSERSVAACLERFRAKGLVVAETPGAYRFEPSQPELARYAGELGQAYRERRVAVIEMLYEARR